MEFTERIESLLEEKNEKRAHLAEVIGVTNQSFTDWKKRGTIPSADIALKIAQHFGVSLEYLLLGEESNPYMEENAKLKEKLEKIAKIAQE